MKLIKLTDENGQTHGGTQWGENVTHTVEWSGLFCSPGCIHVYDDLLVALFLNPTHANFVDPQAWEAEGEVIASDNGLKFGVSSLTTIRRLLPLPEITTTQRVAFGILCAKEIYRDAAWNTWADNWLADANRTRAAARAAADAAADDARAAADAAYDACAAAASASAASASAASAAYAADDAYAARAAARAATYAAARAAADALNLPEIAQRAMSF